MSRTKARRAGLWRVVVIAGVLVGLAIVVRDLRWRELMNALARARLWPLALASLLSFVMLLCKSVCWRIMLAPRFPVPVMRVFRYTVDAFALSVVTPARAGELMRIWLLKTRDGVPSANTLAVAAAEKLLDGITMLLLVAPLPFLIAPLPPWVGHAIVALAAGTLLVVAGVVIALLRIREPRGWLRRFVLGMDVFRRPAALLASLGVLAIYWTADLAAVQLVLWSVRLTLSVAAGMLILFTLNVAIMIPSTPAHVGLFELGAMAGLALLQVPRERGLAFALLYHGMQVVPLLVVAALDGGFLLAAHRGARSQPGTGF